MEHPGGHLVNQTVVSTWGIKRYISRDSSGIIWYSRWSSTVSCRETTDNPKRCGFESTDIIPNRSISGMLQHLGYFRCFVASPWLIFQNGSTLEWFYSKYLFSLSACLSFLFFFLRRVSECWIVHCNRILLWERESLDRICGVINGPSFDLLRQKGKEEERQQQQQQRNEKLMLHKFTLETIRVG